MLLARIPRIRVVHLADPIAMFEPLSGAAVFASYTLSEVAVSLAAAVITLDFDPVIDVGPIEVAWHGLTTAIGILVAAFIATRYARRRGMETEPLITVLVWTVLAGMIGARLLFLIETDPGALLEPSEWLGSRGFSFYGGLIFGAASAALFFRRLGLDLRYLDAVAAGFPLGMAVGRIGDLINGEHYGAVSDLPWAIRYVNPGAEVPSNAVAYHSGGLYEIVLALAIAAVVWAVRDRLRRPGQLLWTVVGLYAIGRFAMFFYRADSETLALGLDNSQWISLALATVAAVGLWFTSDSARRRPHAATALTIVFVTAALFIVSGCFDGESKDSASRGSSAELVPTSEDPDPIHVHGLGVDPADGALFIASHTGLFRVPKGQGEAERVADRYQDTMAFTVVGPGHFLGSGHPDGREDLPPFLGLIETSDAGETWEEVSLMGEADFHLLAAAGQRIYGSGSAWEGEGYLFLASEDQGRTWDKRRVPAPLVGLAVPPRDGRVLIASTRTGLYLSRDGGKSWRPLPGSPGLLTWPRSDQLYLANADGAVRVSTDEGRSWRTVGRLPDSPAAFGDGAGRLLAATHSGMVLESSDGGSTWRVRFEP